MNGQVFVTSWSGGKDSCLAHYRACRAGGVPGGLLTMFIEDGRRSRNHGLSLDVLRAQADALELPLFVVATSWADYERNFVAGLRDAAARGMTGAVFGDIDIESHRRWEEQVCRQAGVAAHLPLWQAERRALLDEFLDLSFEARLVAVKDGCLEPDFLGRTVDAGLVAELEAHGVDACGENGEYHTVVTAGPLFRRPLRLVPGAALLRSGYWFLDHALTG